MLFLPAVIHCEYTVRQCRQRQIKECHGHDSVRAECEQSIALRRAENSGRGQWDARSVPSDLLSPDSIELQCEPALTKETVGWGILTSQSSFS